MANAPADACDATDEATESARDFPPGISPEGPLADDTLPIILLELYGARFTGSLTLSRNKTEKRILIQDGAPVHSESNLANETLGAQLIDQGAIDRADHDRISAYMSREKCKEGVALLALELLDPKTLFLALKEQVRRRLLEVFGWSEGSYRLELDEEDKKEVQPFRSDPYLIVREGLTNHWTADQLLADLGEYMESYPRPTPQLAEAMRRLEDPVVLPLFQALDGRTNLGVAIGSGFSSTLLLSTVWVLARAELIEFSDASIGDDESAEDGEVDIEIEIVGPAAPAAESETPESGRRRRRKTVAARNENEAEEMRQEVTERLERLDELSYYELLEVAENAGLGDIRKAYFKAAKRYHPDALTHLGLVDIKEQAALVFGRIAEANDTLKDAQKRREYDASLLDDHAEIDVNAVAQAETFYRKGEILVKMGDFRGSLEFLKPAVEIWPNEAVYQSALGWALFKQPQSDLATAREHLDKAVELDPEDASAHYRLGLVLRDLGENQRASESLARANILDPSIG